MARKKKSAASTKPSMEWLVTFSDLLTLLITFFVLLISMSSMDNLKLKRTFGFFKGASAALERGSGLTNAPVQLKAQLKSDNPMRDHLSVSPSSVNSNLSNQIKMIRRTASDITQQLRKVQQKRGVGNHPLDEQRLHLLKCSRPVKVVRTKKRLELDLHLGLLFERGTAAFSPHSGPLLRQVQDAALSGLVLRQVQVSPIERGGTSRTHSPWDLAIWRSAALIRKLKLPGSSPACAEMTKTPKYIKLVFAQVNERARGRT